MFYRAITRRKTDQSKHLSELLKYLLGLEFEDSFIPLSYLINENFAKTCIEKYERNLNETDLYSDEEFVNLDDEEGLKNLEKIEKTLNRHMEK